MTKDIPFEYILSDYDKTQANLRKRVAELEGRVAAAQTILTQKEWLDSPTTKADLERKIQRALETLSPKEIVSTENRVGE